MNLAKSISWHRWNSSVFFKSISLMSINERRKIIAVVVIQITLGLLDLVGVAAIGLLGAIAVNGVSQGAQGDRVNSILRVLQLEDSLLQTQVAALGLVAAGLLIVRTILSVYFTRRTLHFLSHRAAVITDFIVSRLFTEPLIKLQNLTTQETIYSLTYGVNAISIGVISTSVSLLADISLLAIMSIGLFVVDPILALSASFLFGGIGLAIFKLLHKRANELGQKDSALTISASQKISDLLQTYRELVVRNRRPYFTAQITNLRRQVSNTQAEIFFLPSVSKYILETSVVVGALAISALQFALYTAAHAVATLAVFLAAATRIAPAVMRVQQGAIQIKGSIAIAGPTLAILEDIKRLDPITFKRLGAKVEETEFISEILLGSVNVKYPNATNNALTNVNIKVRPGSFCAIVGPSGSGKSTLIDVMLGVLPADSGKVLISGYEPLAAFDMWPGKVAYVPQEVSLISGTIRDNILLGYGENEIPDELLFESLKSAQLLDFVNSLPLKLDNQVGERGANLSGGQKQRLGIARALITRPGLIFLDEATSSLDGETEQAISLAIQKLRSSATVVTVAHRLSTVRSADQVIYLELGRIRATGTFDELRAAVPDFDKQAKLMGL